MIAELRKLIRRMHYPLEVMLVCVRWYAAYPLSLRHIEVLNFPLEELAEPVLRARVHVPATP